MIQLILTIILVVVLFGIRISINDAIRSRRHQRRDEPLPPDWRKRFDDQFKR